LIETYLKITLLENPISSTQLRTVELSVESESEKLDYSFSFENAPFSNNDNIYFGSINENEYSLHALINEIQLTLSNYSLEFEDNPLSKGYSFFSIFH
jgi:hypothetical protein